MSNREIPSPGPPSYLWHETCGICWEAYGYSMLGSWWDRRQHRSKWGHDPVPLYAKKTDAERHTENLTQAAAFRERHASE